MLGACCRFGFLAARQDKPNREPSEPRETVHREAGVLQDSCGEAAAKATPGVDGNRNGHVASFMPERQMACRLAMSSGSFSMTISKLQNSIALPPVRSRLLQQNIEPNCPYSITAATLALLDTPSNISTNLPRYGDQTGVFRLHIRIATTASCPAQETPHRRLSADGARNSMRQCRGPLIGLSPARPSCRQ